MRFSDVFAASLVVPLIAAHGADEFHAPPKIIGLPSNAIGALRTRNVFGGHEARVARPNQSKKLVARQAGGNAEGRCGKDFGCATCNEGFCCSLEGYCGNSAEDCQSPDCNFEFGPGCDGNKVPGGGSTRDTPRTKLGNQVYGGEGIYSCVQPGTVALTYDDGPYIYTEELLDLLKTKNAKATFFVTGININKGAIDTTERWSNVIKRMVEEKHQVASHTWSHQDLSAISSAQRYDQLVRNEMALTNILGKFPTYMRPPYSSCTAQSGCAKDMADLGYVVSYFDLDTDDYNQLTPEKIQVAKDNVAKGLAGTNPATDSRHAIAHDIHELTARNLSSYMINYIDSLGYKMVTLGECMGEPEENWYRTPSARTASTSSFTAPTVCTGSPAPSNASNASPTPAASGVSVDGKCGSQSGSTCLGFPEGECCSQYGWCGSTAGHCGTGCQSGFGNCGTSNSSQPSSPAPSPGGASPPAGTPPASAGVSPDSTCGGATGYTCVGFPEGECCSQYGFCGNTNDHCGTGCNPLFGKCTSSGGSPPAQSPTPPAPTPSTPRSSSTGMPPVVPPRSSPISSSRAPSPTPAPAPSPAPTPGKRVSPDGWCAGSRGYTCSGSRFGNCCSLFGQCGSSMFHCRRAFGCKAGFGACV